HPTASAPTASAGWRPPIRGGCPMNFSRRDWLLGVGSLAATTAFTSLDAGLPPGPDRGSCPALGAARVALS
ncbi:MAG TPA: hypothetical protein VE091_12140, partial [Gemmatimonadales bacterium]|nr:hypothetical protein [Gemmatimonadales bacterium]